MIDTPNAVAPAHSRTELATRWVEQRIEARILLPGRRIPSIRRLAKTLGISPFTAAIAFDTLVARGLVEARPGSGHYVVERPTPKPYAADPCEIDLGWLMGNMLASTRIDGPGLGVLPPNWLDAPRAAAALRTVAREPSNTVFAVGEPLGFAPLRRVLQRCVGDFGIDAEPENILLTTGVTHALDLVARTLLAPGDTVLVLAPSWFGTFAILGAHRARIVAVPCSGDGPDMVALEEAFAVERPALMVLSATAQNPTGFTLSEGIVERILALARSYGTLLFEDDTYSDLGAPGATRFAARGEPGRVLYASGFSKTLLAGGRVGFIVGDPEHVERLTEAKILSGFTTPQINERIIHRLLTSRTHARRIASLRGRVEQARDDLRNALEGVGFEVSGSSGSGMFLWTDVGCDTQELAARAREGGVLVAPGALFQPYRYASSWMRCNVATAPDQLAAVLALVREIRSPMVA